MSMHMSVVSSSSLRPIEIDSIRARVAFSGYYNKINTNLRTYISNVNIFAQIL